MVNVYYLYVTNILIVYMAEGCINTHMARLLGEPPLLYVFCDELAYNVSSNMFRTNVFIYDDILDTECWLMNISTFSLTFSPRDVELIFVDF